MKPKLCRNTMNICAAALLTAMAGNSLYGKPGAIIIFRRWLIVARQAALLLFGILLLNPGAVAAEPATQGGASQVLPIFATVGKTVITQQDYDMAFAKAARAKFYHGRPPDAEIAALQREVGDKLIANVLLVREAKRRKLRPDAALIKQKIDRHEQRYRDNEQWQQVRAQELPLITRQLEEESLIDQLEKRVRNVPAPSEKQLRKYYSDHLDKFTAPEQQRVSIILLKVDPSSPSEVWQEAAEEAKDLVARLRAGADFAEMASEHSGDPSAEQGGDMGYLHSGMLAEAAQETVNKLKPGETSDPIRLMEGVAIFRLIDRIPPKQNSFVDAKERVQGLWRADQSEIAWKTLIANLKKKTPIRVNELRYLPLPATTGGPAASK